MDDMNRAAADSGSLSEEQKLSDLLAETLNTVRSAVSTENGQALVDYALAIYRSHRTEL